MSALIFILGLAIGISGFLYILSAISGGMNIIRSSGTEKKTIAKQNIEPDSIGFRGRKNIPPGTRI